MNERGRFGKTLSLALAGVLSAVAVLGGGAICLCDHGPDGCAEACHGCGCGCGCGVAAGEGCCDHLVVPVPDLLAAETHVFSSTPAAAAAHPLPRQPDVRPSRPAAPFRAAAPPDGRAERALFLKRNVLLRS